MEQQTPTNSNPIPNSSQLGHQPTGPNGKQQGEIDQVQQIKKQGKKLKINKTGHYEIEDDSSEWSWNSLEDLKAVDLKALQAEQQDKMENDNLSTKPKSTKGQNALTVVFPPKPEKKQSSTLKSVGQIIQRVGDLLIVQAEVDSTYQVVDLDGWLCDQNFNFLGFVLDVMGKIEQPFYAVKTEEHLQNIDDFIGSKVYFMEGTKFLNQDDVKSIQSKNHKQLQVESEDSDDQNAENEDAEMSMQPTPGPSIYQEFNNQIHPRNNRNPNVHTHNRRPRRSSFDHGDRQHERSRTREHHHRGRHNQNRNNERYLQNVYANHYSQMMQFYNPQYVPSQMQPPNRNMEVMHPGYSPSVAQMAPYPPPMNPPPSMSSAQQTHYDFRANNSNTQNPFTVQSHTPHNQSQSGIPRNPGQQTQKDHQHNSRS